MHWAVMASNLVAAGLFLLLMILIQSYFPGNELVDNLTFYLALSAVVRFTVQTILWWIERIVITDKRVMLAEGIVTHSVSMMPLSKVTDFGLPAHLRRPAPGLRDADRRVGGSNPGPQQDQVHATARGDHEALSGLIFGEKGKTRATGMLARPRWRK